MEGKNASFVVQGKSPALQCTPVVICNISKLGEYFLDHSWKEAISPECGTSLTGIATLGHIGTWQCGSVVVWQLAVWQCGTATLGLTGTWQYSCARRIAEVAPRM